MNCKNLKIKTKKYKKYLYCDIQNKTITWDDCKGCILKKYKLNNINKKYVKQRSKRTKDTDISDKVKKIVWERDNHQCVICGNTYNVMPNAHFVRRSKGGLGIEQNIFTACTRLTENDCHHKFDAYGIGEDKVIAHFKSIYPNWNENDLYYHK